MASTPCSKRGVALNDPSHGGYGISSGSDIVAVPDWHTFRMLPPSTHGPSVAAVFCCLESAGFVASTTLVHAVRLRAPAGPALQWSGRARARALLHVY